jgi:hypothetical protein
MGRGMVKGDHTSGLGEARKREELPILEACGEPRKRLKSR